MNRRAVGTAWEEAAAKRLSDLGYRILEHSFRCREGEIDLIARDGVYLVFIEVRYRKSSRKGHPLETVTAAKQRKICRVSEVYRMVKKLPPDTPIRYDVVSVLDDEMEVVKNAFPYQR